MKKNFKQILSIFLSMVLIFSIECSSFAGVGNNDHFTLTLDGVMYTVDRTYDKFGNTVAKVVSENGTFTSTYMKKDKKVRLLTDTNASKNEILLKSQGTKSQVTDVVIDLNKPSKTSLMSLQAMRSNVIFDEKTLYLNSVACKITSAASNFYTWNIAYDAYNWKAVNTTGTDNKISTLNSFKDSLIKIKGYELSVIAKETSAKFGLYAAAVSVETVLGAVIALAASFGMSVAACFDLYNAQVEWKNCKLCYTMVN